MFRIALLVAALALVVAACGEDVELVPGDQPVEETTEETTDEATEDEDDAGDAAAGACPVEEPDCVDTPELEEGAPVDIGEEGIEQLREDARYYLGVPEDELPDTVRIGRIGEEEMMLTMDLVVGRITVELDDLDGDGTYVVTRSTVELPEGQESFDLEDQEDGEAG